MREDQHHTTHPHGHFEHRDIGVSTVVYFLVGLTVALIVSFFVVGGIYRFLTHHFEAQQPAVSPLVANAPVDTRKLPDDDYEKYLHKNFPEPQLETNERTELNNIRLHEEETLSTYDYVDKSAGTVRIPIDRAMDLLVQRGLPVRAPAGDESKSQQQSKKEQKQ
jgi:hypothetical protein